MAGRSVAYVCDWCNSTKHMLRHNSDTDTYTDTFESVSCHAGCNEPRCACFVCAFWRAPDYIRCRHCNPDGPIAPGSIMYDHPNCAKSRWNARKAASAQGKAAARGSDK